MQVKIKELAAEIELKNKGIELEIRDPSGNFIGDLVINKSNIIWCEGRTKVENGIKLSIPNFIQKMKDESGKSGTAVKKAARKVTKKVSRKVAAE
jgi:hypothetical protein